MPISRSATRPASGCSRSISAAAARSDYDPVPARYNPLTYAGDVIELLDQLGIDQAIFVGTSLGGLVTMVVAATAPQRIAAAILNDVGPDVDPPASTASSPMSARMSASAAGTRRRDTIAANYGSKFDRFTHEDWVEMAKRNCREENGEIRFDYDMAIAEPFRTAGPVPQVDLWPLFAALGQKPLLVVRGEKSDLLTAETAAKMRAIAPAMKLAVVAGVGHAPELSEPEAVAAIDEFLLSR